MRLHEQNPMLGLRGCRLGILFPEIVEMQVKAIAQAAAQLKKEGLNPIPEIMIPLVGTRNEMALERERLEGVVKGVFEAEGVAGRLQVRRVHGSAAGLPGRRPDRRDRRVLLATAPTT